MATIPKLNEELLRKLCAVIADTDEGITGRQIGMYLNSLNIKDTNPTITKRDRLFEALHLQQSKDNCANNILVFVTKVINPVNFVGDKEFFEKRRRTINNVLVFAGYEINEGGSIGKVTPVTTLTEAEARASKLNLELKNRRVHAQVLKYCTPELLQNNYFHAVLESVKGIASRLRQETGLVSDGAELIDEVFKSSGPYLIINSFQTDTEKSEQSGFSNLLKGIFGMFRNVTAHASKIEWPILEEEALDLLTLVSLVHKKLDKAVLIKIK